MDSLEYRQRFLRAGYDRVMPALRLKYPVCGGGATRSAPLALTLARLQELFPEAQFTFELYTFSIRTVLGERPPRTAAAQRHPHALPPAQRARLADACPG